MEDVKKVKRGDVWICNDMSTKGSEQKGRRPVVIIQNDIGNEHSPTVIVANATSKIKKHWLPFHIILDKWESKMKTMVLCEQIRTIDKSRLVEKVGQLDKDTMKLIDKGINISLGLKEVQYASK